VRSHEELGNNYLDLVPRGEMKMACTFRWPGSVTTITTRMAACWMRTGRTGRRSPRKPGESTSTYCSAEHA